MRESMLMSAERKYLELEYSERSSLRLREFCQLNGFDLSVRWDGSLQDPAEFDFHTTVWYTSSEHELVNRSLPCSIQVKPKNFALFGDENNVLVMEIDSPELIRLRERIGDQFDMVDSSPDYRPHITVCYSWDKDLPDSGLLDFFTQPLIASQLNIKTQKTS
jgi:hypothetical protein